MILVDVFVPSVDNIYDFQLDEDVKIEMLIEEMGEMICQKEHCRLNGHMEELLLCSMDDKRILPKNISLSDCGIKTGSKLILL